MKPKAIILALAFASICTAADDPPSEPASQPPPARILAVTPDADKRTLMIRYEKAGAAHEQRLSFPADIIDFRYCRWLGDAGIAIAAETRSAASTDFYCAVLFFDESKNPTPPTRIPAPSGDFHLGGILNTMSLVITAFEHHWGENGERISGWFYTDYCPSPGVSTGSITTFNIPLRAGTAIAPLK